VRLGAVMAVGMELKASIFKDAKCSIVYWSVESVQNSGEEICWKTFIWKTGNKWKDNIIIDFRQMGSEDGRTESIR
jgi:hypothetical protein